MLSLDPYSRGSPCSLEEDTVVDFIVSVSDDSFSGEEKIELREASSSFAGKSFVSFFASGSDPFVVSESTSFFVAESEIQMQYNTVGSSFTRELAAVVWMPQKASVKNALILVITYV